MVNHRDTEEKLTSVSRSMTTNPFQKGFDGKESSIENQQLTISDTSGTSFHRGLGDHRKEQMLDYHTDDDEIQVLFSNKDSDSNLKAPPAKRKRVSNYFGDDTQPIEVRPKKFCFTEKQLQFLRASFKNNHRPTVAEMKEWADAMGVPGEKVRTWFTNKRNHTRKVMSLEEATPILEELLQRDPTFVDYHNAELRDRLGWTRDKIADWFAKARREPIKPTYGDRFRSVNKISRKFEDYSEELLQVLTKSFEANQNPSQDEMKKLADQTGLNFYNVRRWFSSERQTESMRNNEFNVDDEIGGPLNQEEDVRKRVQDHQEDTAPPALHNTMPIQLQNRRLPTTHKNSQDGVMVEVDNIRVHNLQMVNGGIHLRNAPLDMVYPTPDNQRRRVELDQARTHRSGTGFPKIPLPFSKNRNWTTWTNQEVLEFGWQFLNSEAMSNLKIGKIVGRELSKFVEANILLLEAFEITTAEAIQIQEYLTTMNAYMEEDTE